MEKRYSARKKFLFGLIGVLCVCAIFAGVGILARRAHATTVKVIPVSDLDQRMFYDEGDSLLYGEISTSVTQKVTLIDDAVIEKVYVKQGDHVRPGDPLLTYDMTLKQLELELARLQKQDLENKLVKAQQRLESLKNGGPITDPTDDYVPMDDDEDEEAHRGGYLKAFVQIPFLGAAALVGRQSVSDASQMPEMTEEPQASRTPDTTEGPETTEIPEMPEGPVLYELLDYDSRPYRGDGSKESPYSFLCTAREEGVLVKGSFFNKMAGYDREGINKEGDACWYRLEFHENDQIGDLEDPEQSLLGYYGRKGKDAMDPEEEISFTVEGAAQVDDGEEVLTPTPEAPGDSPNALDDDDDDDDDWYDDDDDYEEPTMTREEAIRYQENTVQAYKLDIQRKALSISKMEKLLEQETIISSIEGTVTVVGDPETGDSRGEGFIEVESDDGFYVKGTLGEMMLEQVKVGDPITGYAYESGQDFTAEIREIAVFPSTENQDYMGMGNMNESYYPFLAHVTEDLEMENGESAELKISTGQTKNQKAIYLDAAMVRSDGGQYYVYKDDGGKLRKQLVTAEKSSDGYTVVITKGLSGDDKIAFPYGSGAEDGTETEEGTAEDLYSY